MNLHHKNIVLFDGYCNLCNGSVNFLIRHDKKRKLRYAPLQSKVGIKLQQHFPIPSETDSIIFVAHGTVWMYSDAILEICRLLPYPLKIFSYMKFFSRKWRDMLYQWTARNRYSWFGKRETCRIPSPEEKELFLDDLGL